MYNDYFVLITQYLSKGTKLLADLQNKSSGVRQTSSCFHSLSRVSVSSFSFRLCTTLFFSSLIVVYDSGRPAESSWTWLSVKSLKSTELCLWIKLVWIFIFVFSKMWNCVVFLPPLHAGTFSTRRPGAITEPLPSDRVPTRPVSPRLSPSSHLSLLYLQQPKTKTKCFTGKTRLM